MPRRATRLQLPIPKGLVERDGLRQLTHARYDLAE